MHLLQTTFHPCCPLEGSSRPKNSCSVHLFCPNGSLCVGLRPGLTDGSHSFFATHAIFQHFHRAQGAACSHGCPETAHAKKVGLQTGPRSRAQEVKSLLLHSSLFTWGIMVTRKCCVVRIWYTPLNKAYINIKMRGDESQLFLKPHIPNFSLNVHNIGSRKRRLYNEIFNGLTW